MAARISALVFAWVFVFGLSACGGPGNGAAPSESSQNASVPESSPAVPESSSSVASSDASVPGPSAPDREPIGNPAVIDYPELVGEDLAASPLYRQALERPSVILYDGEIITGPQPVEDFLAAVEKGEDWDLYHYTFQIYDNGERNCYLRHFVSDKGTVSYSYGSENQWDSMDEGGKIAVNDLSLNEYGYLVYGAESGDQVVNDRALYENVQECRKLYDRYFPPILYLGLGSRTWASPQELTSWVGLFEDIYRYETGGSAFDRFGSDWPVAEMVETLSRYFDGITADLVIGERKTSGRYDPETGTIHYEGGRGGGPICYRVTGWEQEGETLAIDYEEYYFYTGVPLDDGLYRLTVKTLEDGSFRYLSNLPRGL